MVVISLFAAADNQARIVAEAGGHFLYIERRRFHPLQEAGGTQTGAAGQDENVGGHEGRTKVIEAVRRVALNARKCKKWVKFKLALNLYDCMCV